MSVSILDEKPGTPDYSLAAALHSAGMSYKQIAEQIGAPSPDAVRKRIERNRMSVLRPAAFTNAVQAGLQHASRDIRQRLASTLGKQLSVLEKSPAKSVKALGNTRQREGIASITKTIANTAATVFDWESEKAKGIIVIGQMKQADQEPAIEVESKQEFPLATEPSQEGGGKPL